MAIQVFINGSMMEVTKQQLFAYAKANAITPDTEILVNGVRSTAGKVKDIVFGTGSDVHVGNTQQFGQGQNEVIQTVPIPTFGNLQQFGQQNQKQEMRNESRTTAMLSIRVVGLPCEKLIPFQGWQTVIAEDKKFESNLINFVINELRKEYQVVASEKKIANAPGVSDGKSGCLVVLAFLGLLAAGSGFGCYTLLMSLLP